MPVITITLVLPTLPTWKHVTHFIKCMTVIGSQRGFVSLRRIGRYRCFPFFFLQLKWGSHEPVPEGCYEHQEGEGKRDPVWGPSRWRLGLDGGAALLPGMSTSVMHESSLISQTLKYVAPTVLNSAKALHSLIFSTYVSKSRYYGCKDVVFGLFRQVPIRKTAVKS